MNTHTRYFYTDPLAAAWMAKHFGMKIIPDPREFPNARDAIFDARGVLMQAALAAMGAPQYRKFYTHLDSLHLLEGQVGDFAYSEYMKAPYLLMDENIEFYSSPDTRKGDKIIQRNGIAFMWPESEAV